MVKKYFIWFLFALIMGFCISQAFIQAQIIPMKDSQNILPLRERVKLTEKWWQWKKEHVLPLVMREQRVDLWIVRDDEADLYYNNQGPVYISLLSANHQGMAYPSQYASPGSQRLPEFLMFYDTGEKIEDVEPRDYEHIAKLVRERDPDTIAIG